MKGSDFSLVPTFFLLPTSEESLMHCKDMLPAVNLFGESGLIKSFPFISLQLEPR